jgi:hypothetical protein
MAKAIEYHQDARIDFDESFDWYRKRSAGAAIGFAAAVDEAISRILADFRLDSRPPMPGVVTAPLRRYPFRLYSAMKLIVW